MNIFITSVNIYYKISYIWFRWHFLAKNEKKKQTVNPLEKPVSYRYKELKSSSNITSLSTDPETPKIASVRIPNKLLLQFGPFRKRLHPDEKVGESTGKLNHPLEFYEYIKKGQGFLNLFTLITENKLNICISKLIGYAKFVPFFIAKLFSEMRVRRGCLKIYGRTPREGVRKIAWRGTLKVFSRCFK